jgi:hypothetical protein
VADTLDSCGLWLNDQSELLIAAGMFVVLCFVGSSLPCWEWLHEHITQFVLVANRHLYRHTTTGVPTSYVHLGIILSVCILGFSFVLFLEFLDD